MSARPITTRRALATIAAGTALLSAAACGGDDSGSGSGDFSIAGALAQLPESALNDNFIITASDLDRATELAGATRPDADADFDETFEWLKQIDGVFADDDDNWPIVAVLLPEAASIQYLQDIDGFRDELGWSLLQVSSYAETSLPPGRFTVLDGEFDFDAIDDAIDDKDGDIWKIGGDDFEVSVGDRTAARPIGESLRLAEQDGQLAVSKSTPPIEDWLENDDDRVADDEDLLAVAEALDEHDVYTAMLLDADSLTYSPGGRDVPPEVAEQLERQLLTEFEAFGAGLTVVDDEPVGVLAYEHSDEADAEENAELLQELFDNGTSFRTADPLEDLFPDAEVTVDGTTVVVTVHFGDGRAVNLWNAIQSQEIFVVHD